MDGGTDHIWLLGVFLSVSGTLAGTVGKQLVRLAAMRRERGRESLARLLLVIGILLQVTLNPCFDLAAYALTPASVLAPFTGLDIVWNTLLSPFTLKERLTRDRATGSMVVFLAATSSAYFREVQEVDWTADHVRALLCRVRTLAYVVGFFGWLLFSTRVLMRYPVHSTVRGFAFGATAGSLSGNMWCTRIVSVFLAQCLGGVCADWRRPIAWLLALAAVLCATVNLYFISEGLREYEALFMVTIFMGSNIVTNSFSATIVLDEMASAPAWKACGYVGCILAILGGMYLLARGEHERRPTPPCESGHGLASHAAGLGSDAQHG